MSVRVKANFTSPAPHDDYFTFSRVIKPPIKTITMRNGTVVEFYTPDSIIINSTKQVKDTVQLHGSPSFKWSYWLLDNVGSSWGYGHSWESGDRVNKFRYGNDGCAPYRRYTIATFTDDLNNIDKAMYFDVDKAYQLADDGALYLSSAESFDYDPEKYKYYICECFKSDGSYTTNADAEIIPYIRGLDGIIVPDVPDPLAPGGSNMGGGTGSGIGINGTSTGANGTFSAVSDEIALPTAPVVDIVNTGMFSVYAMNQEQIQSLGEYLWNSNFADTIKKLFSDPMEAIMGSMVFPFSLSGVSGTDTVIKIGNVETDLQAKKLNKSTLVVDCGSLDVEGYWGNAMDYSPYTRASIYLPYSGIHDININDIMNRSLNVTYNVDLFSGTALIALTVTDTDAIKKILYTFSAKIGSDIPLTARDMATFYSQIATTVTAAGIGVAGAVAAPATGGASLAAAGVTLSTAKNVASADIAVQHSGRLDSYIGNISPQYPYLILTRPAQSLPEYYNSFRGYPSNITANLGQIRGYTEVAEIHLENVSATQVEKNEIIELLKGGVIL